MNVDRWFRGATGSFRAPWRLLAFVVAFIVGGMLAQAFAYPAMMFVGGLLGLRLSLDETILTIGLLVAHLATLRWMDGRPWRDAAMGEGSLNPRGLVAGTLVGLLGIGIPILLLIGVGWLALAAAAAGSSLGLAARLLVYLAPAALWEELAFRGYPLTILGEWFGARAAVVVTSLVFGLIHLTNPGADWRAVGLVTLAGIWLGVVRLATGSLWAAWLAHLAWNWTMAGLAHAPVSGLGFAVVDWRVVDAGPDWATGGAWGPEGGAFAALGMLGGSLWFMARPRVARRTPDDSNDHLQDETS